jgi:predicted ArsR family transcriptional regulator
MPTASEAAGERSRTHGVLASASWVHILDLLRGGDPPLDVAQIGVRTALHPNTVRFHLKVLVDAGLALLHRLATFAGVSADEAIRQVAAMFAELGFQSELDGGGSHRRILLHACPFDAVASKHPDVVCAVHLGLLRQTLTNLDAPIEATALEPFVTPHLCVAHLAATSSSSTESPRN